MEFRLDLPSGMRMMVFDNRDVARPTPRSHSPDDRLRLCLASKQDEEEIVAIAFPVSPQNIKSGRVTYQPIPAPLCAAAADVHTFATASIGNVHTEFLLQNGLYLMAIHRRPMAQLFADATTDVARTFRDTPSSVNVWFKLWFNDYDVFVDDMGKRVHRAGMWCFDYDISSDADIDMPARNRVHGIMAALHARMRPEFLVTSMGEERCPIGKAAH
jgi:hypothetical protein